MARDDAADVVAEAAGISQALWDVARDIFVRDAEYPLLLLLAEMGLYARLHAMASRAWSLGWQMGGLQVSGPGRDLSVQVPGGLASVVGSPMMAKGAWMVLRVTEAGSAPEGQDVRGGG